MLLPQSFQPLSAGPRPAGSFRNSLVYNYMEASRDPLVVFEALDAAGARLRLQLAVSAGECPEQPDQVDDVVAHRALLRARLDLLAAQD